MRQQFNIIGLEFSKNNKQNDSIKHEMEGCKMLSYVRNNKQLLLLYFALLLFTPVVNLIVSGVPSILLPRFYTTVFWIVPLGIIFKIQNIFSRAIGFFWVAWFIMGSINMIASYRFYGDFYLLNVEFANIVYLIFFTVYIGAIYLFERYFDKSDNQSTNVLKYSFNSGRPVFKYFLLAFPFLWILSLYFSIGHVPILSGINVEEAMYENEFGPLYGYAGVNIISMIFVFGRLRDARTRMSKFGYGLLMLCFPLFSIASGKRMALMCFFGGALCYLVKKYNNKVFNRIFLVGGVGSVAILYIGLQVLRQGFDLNAYQALDAQFSVVGCEYRDFVYAVDKFNPVELATHGWATSTFVAAVNARALEIMGVDKQKKIELAFGYVSKPYFSGGFFGVRTGLVCELYFAYKFFGLLIIGIFGILTAFISKKLQQSKSEGSFIFLAGIYALFLLVVVEQSIDVAGTLTVFLYAFFLYYLLNKININMSSWFNLKTKQRSS